MAESVFPATIVSWGAIKNKQRFTHGTYYHIVVARLESMGISRRYGQMTVRSCVSQSVSYKSPVVGGFTLSPLPSIAIVIYIFPRNRGRGTGSREKSSKIFQTFVVDWNHCSVCPWIQFYPTLFHEWIPPVHVGKCSKQFLVNCLDDFFFSNGYGRTCVANDLLELFEKKTTMKNHWYRIRAEYSRFCEGTVYFCHPPFSKFSY